MEEASSRAKTFSEREIGLIGNCRAYGANDPAGLPGHNLLIIIAKMAAMLDILVLTQSVNSSRKATREWIDVSDEVKVKSQHTKESENEDESTR